MDRLIKPFGMEMLLEIGLYWQIFHEWLRYGIHDEETFDEFAYDLLVDEADREDNW